jgi:YfiR/HmsC-like
LNIATKIRRSRWGPGTRIGWLEVSLPRSRLALATLTALLFTVAVRWVSAQATGSSEYQVKAAFLFHFAQFVEWPPEVSKSANSPVTYCTVGGDPFRGALDASLNEKTINGRPVRVLHVEQAQEAQGCQILFIGTTERKYISQTLASLKGAPMLTVGEAEHFALDGGMIGFLLEDNKVRFEINLDAAEHAKLKISARLLALAKTVIGSPKGI